MKNLQLAFVLFLLLLIVDKAASKRGKRDLTEAMFPCEWALRQLLCLFPRNIKASANKMLAAWQRIRYDKMSKSVVNNQLARIQGIALGIAQIGQEPKLDWWPAPEHFEAIKLYGKVSK